MEAHAPPSMSSTMFLQGFGDVVLTFGSDDLSWAPLASLRTKSETCLGLMFSSTSESKIKFLDIYAVEFTDWGQIHGVIPNVGPPFPFCQTEMYRFVVHGFQRSGGNKSNLAMVSYNFGHKHLQTCQTWFQQIHSHICMETDRPKNLWVFVHPLSGKGNGCKTWQTVSPIFSRAKVKTKVTVTERAGHAYDLVASSTEKELSSFDGIVSVGGDGFFNEILNGLLISRHKAPDPLVPEEFMHSVGTNNECEQFRLSDENKIRPIHDLNGSSPGLSHKSEDDPLLSISESSVSGVSDFRKEAGAGNTDQDVASFFLNERFRLGIIPAGSTDAIVISTTGARDPVTSALHIILGKRVRVDIAQVVRWEGGTLSSMRYAASFAGYGFYGDVIKESEKYRWMGPKRYDYAGTRVFLEHRSYEAEVAFLEDKSSKSVAGTSNLESGMQQVHSLWDKPKEICSIDCRICKESTSPAYMSTIDDSELKWLWSKGHFLSVGAAIISCRNGRAPDGLVADAHLADGFLHLILIKDCPRPFYLWHLTRLTRKGSNPLDFAFVEHHKTKAFTFVSMGNKESVWNVDGELFQARKLSVQVFQGLVCLFAAGPED